MNRRRLAWMLILGLLALLGAAYVLLRGGVLPATPGQRVVRVAFDPQIGNDTYGGYGSSDETSKAYLALLSQTSGRSLSYVKTDSYAQSLQLLRTGGVDVVPSVLDLPDAVPTEFLASEPYYQGSTVIITRPGHAGVGALAALKGKLVAFKRGGQYEQWLSRYHPGIHRMPLSTVTEVLAAVESDTAEAAIGMDGVYAPLVRRQYPGSLKVAGTADELPVSVRLLVRKDDGALLQALDVGIKRLSPEHQAQVLSRWLDAVYQPHPALGELARRFSKELLLGAFTFIALLLALYKTHRLRAVSREAAQQKARLLAVISHEVRNSAHASLAAVELLLHQPSLPDQRPLLEAASASGTSLRMLLDNALEYSRHESGLAQSHFSRSDIVDIARQCVLAFEPQAAEKGIDCHLTLPQGGLPWLMLDEVSMRQLLFNLLSNAIKFTHHGQVVLAVWLESAEDELDELHLTVSDTGAGIPLAAQRELFAPFVQAKGARMQGGVGLGLSICQSIVSKLHGRLQLDSAPGRGSCFSITLPVMRAKVEDLGGDASPITAPTATSPAQSQVHSAVLVVDDHAFSAQMLAAQVRSLGYTVILAGTGAEALALLDEYGPFHLILLDCNLPDQHGFDLLAAMRATEARKQWPTEFAVAISAITGQEHRTACLAAGFGQVLSKPFELRQLAEVFAQSEGRAIPPSTSLWGMFVDSLQRDLLALESAVADGEAEEVIYRAHRIHGGALMAEENEVAALSQTIEALWRETPALSESDRTLTDQLLSELRAAQGKLGE